MEPNKFEENIRTKFEERELQPSAGAWSKLERQLGTPKSSNKTIWYAIAASLVAMLVVGSFLLKDKKTVSNEIVEQTTLVKTLNDTEVATSEENPATENATIEDENQTEIKTTNTKAVQSIQKTPIAITKVTPQTGEKKEAVYGQKPATELAQVAEKLPKTEAFKKLEGNDFIKLKVDEVVAQVENLQKTNSTLTVEAVDALLQKAQRDIANQRLLDQAATKIDPASLLNDVENELERSFRDKVFDALGEGFHTVRTAVLERNN